MRENDAEGMRGVGVADFILKVEAKSNSVDPDCKDGEGEEGIVKIMLMLIELVISTSSLLDGRCIFLNISQ